MKLRSIFTILLLSSSAFGQPAQIIIIRHGEKPPTGNGLTQRGCERAYGLKNFFENDPTVNKYGKPVALYGMRPGKPDGNNESGSLRPLETITPTAVDLKLPIEAGYTRTDFQGIVQDIIKNHAYDGKTVIISWEHKAIPELARQFGLPLQNYGLVASDPKTNSVWPSYVFDQAWVLGFTKNNPIPSLNIIPEHVLPGDNPKGGLKNWQENGDGTDAQCPVVSPSVASACNDDSSLITTMLQDIQPPLPQSPDEKW